MPPPTRYRAQNAPPFPPPHHRLLSGRCFGSPFPSPWCRVPRFQRTPPHGQPAVCARYLALRITSAGMGRVTLYSVDLHAPPSLCLAGTFSWTSCRGLCFAVRSRLFLYRSSTDAVGRVDRHRPYACRDTPPEQAGAERLTTGTARVPTQMRICGLLGDTMDWFAQHDFTHINI